MYFEDFLGKEAVVITALSPLSTSCCCNLFKEVILLCPMQAFCWTRKEEEEKVVVIVIVIDDKIVIVIIVRLIYLLAIF